jgi:hypothetical protein
MSNLRLLSSKTFEVKDLPFDKDEYVDQYSLLMPIEFCKKIAEFKFAAQFNKSLPPDLIYRPIEPSIGYFLSTRIIFDK